MSQNLASGWTQRSQQETEAHLERFWRERRWANRQAVVNGIWRNFKRFCKRNVLVFYAVPGLLALGYAGAVMFSRSHVPATPPAIRPTMAPAPAPAQIPATTNTFPPLLQVEPTTGDPVLKLERQLNVYPKELPL